MVTETATLFSISTHAPVRVRLANLIEYIPGMGFQSTHP